MLLRLAFVPVLALLLVLGAAATPGERLAQAARPSAYRIIVHPDNQSSVLDRTYLEDAFLKKVTRWPNGEVIRPVDLPPDSPVRRAFTRDVLERSVEAVKGYWQQRIFSGRDVPPPELDSDDAVVKFVRSHPGGVGYVSATAELAGCRPVEVQ